jgi:hypothetical protein
MVSGIKKWFSENWPVIVAALIGIIAGAILANILTGGAIMAALPLVMQLVAAYFAAEAIMNMTKHFGAYLGKAFPGDVGGGAKSLARALAIGSIELVFALLFGGKAAFKAVKNVAKTAAKGGVKGLAKSGVAAAKASVKSTAKAAKDLAKVAKNGLKTAGKNIVKGGKFALQGLKNGFSRGAKSVRALAGKLRELRFRKFRITIQNRKWRLEGKVNPWVLLASGDIVEGKGKVGDEVTVNGQKGIVVGSHGTTPGVKPSGYVDDLTNNMDQAGRAREFQQLEGLTPTARTQKFWQSGIPRDPNFRPNYFKQLENLGVTLSENAKKFLSVHHIAPNFLKGHKVIDDFVKKMGYSIDDVQNAIGLPRVNLNNIDDTCRQLDDLARQADDLAKAGKQLSPEDLAKKAKLQADLDKMTESLKLPKGMSADEIKKLSDELAAFKGSSVHDSYHSAYNSMVKKKFEELIGLTGKIPDDVIKARFDNFIQGLRADLASGAIKL